MRLTPQSSVISDTVIRSRGFSSSSFFSDSASARLVICDMGALLSENGKPFRLLFVIQGAMLMIPQAGPRCKAAETWPGRSPGGEGEGPPASHLPAGIRTEPNAADACRFVSAPFSLLCCHKPIRKTARGFEGKRQSRFRDCPANRNLSFVGTVLPYDLYRPPDRFF